MEEAETLKTDSVFIDANIENSYGPQVGDETRPVETKLRVIKTGMDPYLVVQERKIRCPECQRFTAETEEKMIRHIRRVHRGENPFQCSLCDYSTYNKAVFEEHVRVHQGIKPFKCSYCDYRSVSKKNTKKHEQIHRPDNPLKCQKCGFIARHFKALAHHKSTKCLGEEDSKETEDSLPLSPKQNGGKIGGKKCGTCQQKFVLNENFEQHKIKCKICNKKLCPHSMKRHLHSIHSKTDDDDKKTKKFVCSLCKWSGNVKARILLHLIHHPDQIVDESIVNIQILRDFGIMK